MGWKGFRWLESESEQLDMEIRLDHNSGKHRFRIQGMDCAEEVIALKRELVPLVGDEQRLSFDLLQSKLTVDSSETGLRVWKHAAIIRLLALF
jgi:hypothetical protein